MLFRVYCGLTVDYYISKIGNTYWPFICLYTDTYWCCLTMLKCMYFMSVHILENWYETQTYLEELLNHLETTLISRFPVEISLISHTTFVAVGASCDRKLSDQINGWLWRVLKWYCQSAPSSSGMWIAVLLFSLLSLQHQLMLLRRCKWPEICLWFSSCHWFALNAFHSQAHY